MAHLFSGFFQIGYVTRDLDAAIAAYRARFGTVEFLVNEPGIVDGQPSPTRRLGLAYLDDVMIELIEPEPDAPSIFHDALPTAIGDLGLHHLGYLIDDHAAMLARLDALGIAVPLHGTMPGVLDYSYADTRAELAHFSEFIRLEEGGRRFFDAVPRLKTR